ncbi:hypothetical protein [Actinospongicola halichondriae]|uniref:hypothetical protein n=1 Tax=Actinospongicola halichondriae TaxID=3236844 RepID=UPI003D50AAA8
MAIQRLFAAAAVALLALGACGSDGDSSDESADSSTTTEAVDETTTTEASDDAPDDDPDETPTGIGTCDYSQTPLAPVYVVTGIADDDPDGGLVARQLPGAGEDEIDVLPQGEYVDTRDDADACAVTSDGAVWWNIGTPLLATGGWVNTQYLEIPLDEDQDSYDLVKAQVACIYDGFAEACDLLEQDGLTAQGNYGLGNSYSMAPDDAISSQCDEGDEIACAEQEYRKGGGE